MSDVFVSYARPDRALAQSLADDLKAKGYRVWWDAELVGSDDFYDVILQALSDAKAAIVIWTKSSAKSKFVRDEARFADHLGKLIAVKEAGLTIYEVPFGFQSQHTDDVSDREQIVRALQKLGVKAASVASASPPFSLATIGDTDRVDELVAVLGADPPPRERQAAIARLKQLASEGAPGKGQSDLVREVGASKGYAFWRGLTFSLPKFQLSSQGSWGAIGSAIGLLLLMALGIICVFLIARTYDDDHTSHVTTLGITVGLAFFCWLSWNRLAHFTDANSSEQQS